MKLNLNIKRTVNIGFAFFTILMLWQVYNSFAPLFLKELLVNKYGDNDYNYLIGVIMALDNILALFMLPLFGNMSDKTNSRIGKRMPYIIVGTILSVLAFPFISIMFINNSLIGVALMMGLILIAMNIYRAPSVALMPDVTPKPLRAKANAIINFVGYTGAIIGGGLTMLFTKTDVLTGGLVKSITIWPFVITSIFMVVALVVLLLKIRENKIISEMASEMEAGEALSETVNIVADEKPLTGVDRKNLLLLIGSIFLWFFAFNAVETFGSTYFKEYLLQPEKWGFATIILAISSLVAFLPSSYLVKLVGRKYSIMIGLVVMIFSLGIAFFIKSFGLLLMLMFVFAGIGWAIINVSSYPMFVELASSKNVGKFTGYYYASSQIAQSITPIAIGFILDWLGLRAYFGYATIFMIFALVVFSFVTTKKSKSTLKNNI